MTIIAGPLPTPTSGDKKITPTVDRRARYSHLTAGVLATGDGQVTAAPTPDMTVRVAAISGALIDDGVSFGDGKYWFESDAQATVGPVTASDPGNPRIDLIVAKVQDTDAGDGSLTPQLTYITGTPAASPAAPAVPARCLALAEVRIDAAATTITSGKITDRRVVAASKLASSSDLLEYVPGSNTDSPAFTGSWTTWLTLGSLTVPAWASKARFMVTVSGWFGITAAETNKLRLKIGAVADDAAPEVSGVVNDRRTTSWQGKITGLSAGAQSVVIENNKTGGTGMFRADTTTHVAVQVWWEP
jgi:hypothetical protein